MGSVITREDVLMPGYNPDSLLHRGSEIKEISEAIKPLFEGRHPDNLFIYGDPGTGKTACIKHILKKLEGNSRVKSIYVNCWQHSTRMAIYSLITKTLEEMMPRRGLARDEVYDRIIEMMEKDGTRVLLVLDDIEGLFFHNEGKLLHDVARAGNGKPFFGVIGISDNGNLLSSKGVGNSIQFSRLEFKHYSAAQMADILAQRAKLGLSPGSWDGKTIEACAQKAVAGKSNVKAGLELLWAAAKRAEKAGRAKITLEDVKAADERRLGNSAGLLENGFNPSSMGLSDEQQLILDIVKTGPISSTNLYLAFFRKFYRSKRQIRNYLGELEAKKLLSIQTVDGASPLLNMRVIQLGVGR
ncbi:MAG: orc1/cdc6 family replication initiation protein [Candidatus Micrarchaeota archaeon]|nr:orc1/cdc6 family replication initiation protein [Candidatus Micrarchaeota archaeon]